MEVLHNLCEELHHSHISTRKCPKWKLEGAVKILKE